MFFVVEGEVSIMVPKTFDELKNFKDGSDLFLATQTSDVTNQKLFEILNKYLNSDLMSLVKKNVERLDPKLRVLLVHFRVFMKSLKHELYLYFANRGRGKYYKNGVFLYKKVTSILSKGYFGEISLINNGPRNSTAYCRKDTTIYSLKKEKFDV